VSTQRNICRKCGFILESPADSCPECGAPLRQAPKVYELRKLRIAALGATALGWLALNSFAAYLLVSGESLAAAFEPVTLGLDAALTFSVLPFLRSTVASLWTGDLPKPRYAERWLVRAATVFFSAMVLLGCAAMCWTALGVFAEVNPSAVWSVWGDVPECNQVTRWQPPDYDLAPMDLEGGSVSTVRLDPAPPAPFVRGEKARVTYYSTRMERCEIDVGYPVSPEEGENLKPKTVDESGSVSWTWQVPSDLTPGVYDLMVECECLAASAGLTAEFSESGLGQTYEIK
jgi:hypothetical protein